MAVSIDHTAVEAFFADPDGPVGRIIEQKAYAVENAAKRLLLIPGSGASYGPGVHFFRRGRKVYRFERSVGHQASAPGEPPSSDTGYLLNSINHTMGVDTTVFARVSASANYALYLELGTRYMAPRPFLRPALDIGLAE